MSSRTQPSGPRTVARPRPAVPTELLVHLRRARDHLDREYRSPVDLDELAEIARVSKYHFARSFAVTYGETPIRYLTRRRIERAQDLLRSANLTVTEICMAVGFSSLGRRRPAHSGLLPVHERGAESEGHRRDRT